MTTYDRPNHYKLIERGSPKLTFKSPSNARRIQTEAYDPMEQEEITSPDRFQFSLANYKSYLPSKSSKKSNLPSYLEYKKITHPPTLSTNTDMGSTLSRNTELRAPKEVAGTSKLNIGSKYFSGKNENYKKHARVRTEACE